MFIAMGYDAVVRLYCSYVSTQIGFGSSWQNPFGLAVARVLPVFRSCPVHGSVSRYGSSSPGLTIVFTMRYAVKDQERSAALRCSMNLTEEYRKNSQRTAKRCRRSLSATSFSPHGRCAACMVWTIWGVVSEGLLYPGDRFPVLRDGSRFRYHRRCIQAE